MNITSIAHAERELGKLYTAAHNSSSRVMALDSIRLLFEAAGNPHDKLRVLHVAGTSGKTSTAYYCAALLQSAGKKVGLTVSPHVDSITERIQIDGSPISEKKFCKELGVFLDYVYAAELTPSYFETMIGFALWLFEKEGVDYAVVETGLGGLLDCTNIVTSQNKVCVVTDIGKDHIEVLGSDIYSIAQQKAGIIHEGNKVFVNEQGPEIMRALRERVDEKQTTLNVLGSEEKDDTHNPLLVTLPRFQRRNWQLSRAAVDYIAKRDQFQITDILDPLSVTVPGRMEASTLPDGTTMVLDGAHNGQKVTAFVSSFQEQYPGQKATVLLALKEGKEYAAVLEALMPITEHLAVTTFEAHQDFPLTSQNPSVIVTAAEGLGIDAAVVMDSKQAYGQLLRSSANIKLVIGSIYLLGQVRTYEKE